MLLYVVDDLIGFSVMLDEFGTAKWFVERISADKKINKYDDQGKHGKNGALIELNDGNNACEKNR